MRKSIGNITFLFSLGRRRLARLFKCYLFYILCRSRSRSRSGARSRSRNKPTTTPHPWVVACLSFICEILFSSVVTGRGQGAKYNKIFQVVVCDISWEILQPNRGVIRRVPKIKAQHAGAGHGRVASPDGKSCKPKCG